MIIGVVAALGGSGPAAVDAIASGGVALFGGATNAAVDAIATNCRCNNSFTIRISSTQGIRPLG